MLHNRQLKEQSQNLLTIEGVVKNPKKGLAWLETNTKQKYLISNADMKRVMHGDRIMAILQINENEVIIAKPEKLLEAGLKRFIGRIQKTNLNWSILPCFHVINNPILCRSANNIKYNFQVGDWAIAEMHHHPLIDLNSKGFYAELIEFITSATDNLAPWWVTLVKYDLERNPPVMNHTISGNLENDQLHRKDLTKLPFITIDNDSTEDMDDALYAEEISKDLFRLTIAIADPTTWIRQNSELDQLAANRSFSTYLPNCNVPMFPRKFSEDVCSLRPGLRRPVLICQMIIKSDGRIIFSEMKFFSAWIISRAKLIYKKVSDWLENIGKWQPETETIAFQLRLLNRIYIIRHNWRKNHALVLNKEQPQYHFVFNGTACISDIKVELRRIGNFIVEEMMIAANICASQLLREKLGFGIYNMHIGFDNTHVQLLVDILAKYGLDFNPRFITTLQGYSKLHRVIDSLCIPYLKKIINQFNTITEITTQPQPHFGLGLECYATWTSPIRKYGDLINHRLIKSILRGEILSAPSPSIETIILIMKERRRLNRLAQHDINNWLYSIFLKKYLNTKRKFTAEIHRVIKTGLYIKIIENGARAFIPGRFIHSRRNELIFNQEIGTVKINNLQILTLGDLITVYIYDINQDTHQIIACPIYS
ncbi:MAG: exoribonuclease II [Candidatus Dasytiphilus stammeri]